MIVPATTVEEKATLLAYMASKIGSHPQAMVGHMPFEIVGTYRKDSPTGAILYTNFRSLSIEMAWAGEPGWLSRQHLHDMFAYPFNQLGCLRVWGIVKRNNKASRSLAEKIGCRVVGVADNEFGPGLDGIIYSITKENCRWVSSGKPAATFPAINGVHAHA